MAIDDDLHLLSPVGFSAAGIAAGLKKNGKNDLGLLVCTTGKPATAAAAFTQNRVVSASITVGRQHLANGKLTAVVVNSGNANACTGQRGESDARATCHHLAKLLHCNELDVLPSSTGIIGHRLPMDILLPGVGTAVTHLGTSRDHSLSFERAILTTDLVPKRAAVTVRLGSHKITIAGVTKGSGMIGPMLAVTGTKADREGAMLSRAAGTSTRQATMLAYLTTDADLTPAALRKLLQPSVQRTFNRTTIDGHASTNDTCLIMANGASGVTVNTNYAAKFESALTEVCDSLAYQIAADGEGASKVVVVRVSRAASESEAAAMAMAIAESPLVKTALHGNDPNWGRIVSMAGKAAARDRLTLDPTKCSLTICGTTVFRRGAPAPFDAPALSQQMAAKHIELNLAIAAGRASAHVYTCDLSREYIAINADWQT